MYGSSSRTNLAGWRRVALHQVGLGERARELSRRHPAVAQSRSVPFLCAHPQRMSRHGDIHHRPVESGVSVRLSKLPTGRVVRDT